MERIKNPFGIFRRQSYTGISERDDQLTLGISTRANGQFAFGAFHGLDRVQHQVHENLLKLDAISDDSRRICVDFGMDRYRVPSRFGSEQSGHFSNNSSDVDHLTFRRLAFFVEGPQTVDDIGRTVPLLLTSSCCRARPFDVGGIMCKPTQTSAGACD